MQLTERPCLGSQSQARPSSRQGPRETLAGEAGAQGGSGQGGLLLGCPQDLPSFPLCSFPSFFLL